jgi:hypothetical protein
VSYVYIQSEPCLWTVGHHGPNGEWHPDSDHGSREDAGARVAYLNGGASPGLISASKGFAAYIEEYFSDDLQCDHAVNLCGCSLKGEIAEVKEAIAKAEGRSA